ncbi:MULTISPECIES: Holliday junction branch migration protein RuvA [Anaerococcus]|jgi:holliday junction DNA helicase ruvA|uniref:Holliday junction branch migration complex subunit RuvA n=1 Tax=Anaerococcus octavius TaxID=54007 RepID=A0A2I1M9X9_9FIRM|nr:MULTISPECIES: Holliday junction branch migration protein RuvA [Anaerococcus]MDU2598481.1 Holliday junction branch migration protein RuvA [Anaerococcus sp.]MDU3176294.1 Holliday junction branch migration protein RuvA [Anaerococcus sp.]MDU4025403.1 Holliday junction branch migration protein RuvA [Anaerococcus sp.]MDU5534921.1 Holliday junction branch migration protein RuvA [Anaerococcus sp.]MDU7411660.1 Holliday junction branch migration protein RuvA [Anaerococcus sp.]
MISYIIGDVRVINEEDFIIENNNIGYQIKSSLSTLAQIELNNEYKIYTSLQVREDDMSLYGFFSKDELEMFLLLTSVSSIGPKNAITILSSLGVEEIKLAIANNDIDALIKAKGVGKKTASRIILELMDKVKLMPMSNKKSTISPLPKNEDLDVAKEALQNLGYAQNDIANVLNELKDMDLSLEDLIKESLKRLI